MAARRRAPVFSQNFDRNLRAIKLFLESDQAASFETLLDRLFKDIIPMICRHPRLGRTFLRRAVHSADARILRHRLRSKLAREEMLREFIVDDYLVLYLAGRDRVVFLSIKHHRQLSFDLSGFWAESP